MRIVNIRLTISNVEQEVLGMDTEIFRTVLPLMNSAFQPGTAQETVEKIEDEVQRKIAQAELFYFSGRAEECKDIVELLIMHEDWSVRLSAYILYGYANLTLGNARAARMSFVSIRKYMKEILEREQSEKLQAACVFVNYIGAVLLHLPSDGLPPLQEYSRNLPAGLRTYAVYVMAHDAYLKGDYERSLGLCEAALMALDAEYPICMIYLYCMISMCQINLKRQEKAKETLLHAWEIAKPDELIEAFIEHHGLLQGLIESCLKKNEPEAYKKISASVIAFSRGWMKIHNPVAQASVTDELSPMEFSIAMLACRNWSNQEIANYLGLSINTIKHYISNILSILQITKREEIIQYVLR